MVDLARDSKVGKSGVERKGRRAQREHTGQLVELEAALILTIRGQKLKNNQ